MGEQVSRMRCIYAVEYFSVLKRKDILAHASTWVILGDIMLREISQSHKGQILNDSIYMKYLE